MKFLSFLKGRRRTPAKSPLDRIVEMWGDSAESLGSLSKWQTVGYCTIVCRRFHPFYVTFADGLLTGDVKLLTRIREHLLQYLRDGGVAKDEHAKLVAEIDRLHKGEEEILSGEPDAIDALIAHASALDVLTGDLRSALWLLDACYNAADREAMDQVLPLGGIVTREIEAKVRNSEQMRREDEWQRAIIASLRNTSSIAELEQLADEFAGGM
jgi:hypothetical protein